jgi:hypothetical protein
MKKVSKSAVAILTFASAAIFSFGWSEHDGVSLSVESVQARVGRPLTPVSVAGVARRQHRRNVYGTAAIGAGVAGAAMIGTPAAVAATAPYGGAGYYAGGPYYRGAGYYSRGPYYQGGPRAAYASYPVQDYATRNGFVCQPGTMVRLDDGHMYPCQ